TPLTRTSIVLLKGSSTNPIGTRRIPGNSIHGISVAPVSDPAKTIQLQIKLTRTATTEIPALRLRPRPVTSAISAALTSGASRTSQGIIRLYPLNTLKTLKVKKGELA